MLKYLRNWGDFHLSRNYAIVCFVLSVLFISFWYTCVYWTVKLSSGQDLLQEKAPSVAQACCLS